MRRDKNLYGLLYFHAISKEMDEDSDGVFFYLPE